MKKRINTRGQSGFSILEVVIGIFIFAVGLLALSALQGALTRSMADAKVRTTAANIAERLIENQRGFTRLISDTVTPPTFLAYNDIVSLNDTEDVNGITYTIDMDVTDYYYQLAGDNFTEAVTGASTSDYKQVEVTVSWNAAQSFRREEGELDFTAADLGSGNIVITAAIPALTTSASAKVADESTDGLDLPPISYTPGLNPDIVSLSLGDSKFKESLLPEPDVIRADELVETRFDVITYSQTNNGAQFLRREEFAIVACECTLRAPDKLSRRPVVWAGDEYVRGQFVKKTFGESANNQQSILCDSCCRDHHDGGTSTEPADHADAAVNTYVPFKPDTEFFSSGTFAGDHKHYARPSTGPPIEVTNANNDYVEACRMVRQDGFFRVAQDFRREDLNVFPADYLDDEAEIDVYSAYVTGAASTYAAATFSGYEDSDSKPCIGPSPCVVAEAPKQSSYDAPIVLANGELPAWSTLPLAFEPTQQLRSRGVYFDYLSYDIRQILLNCDPDINDADDNVCKSGDVVLDRTASVNHLELIPFFDVQMTKLNRWNETPYPNIPVDSTNEPLADDNAHSRGVASKSADGESTVVANGHRGNLGFTDTMPIDPDYAGEVKESDIRIHAGASTPITGTNISGSLTETVPGNPDIVVTGIKGAQCGQTSVGYECIVPTAEVNPQIEITGYGKKGFDRYACSTGDSLSEDSSVSVTNGENAKAVFNLAAVPAGTNYNFVIQATPCPL